MSKNEIAVTSAALDTDQFNALVIDAIQDIKGKKIVKMDLRKTEGAPTDFFILCEGESVTQVKAISSNIEKRISKELGVKPNHTEGTANAQWVLVDYFTTVVHVFHPETRKFYDIEELWSDADTEEFSDL